MGVITRMLGVGDAAQNIGSAVEGVAEVFTINKTKAELAARAQSMAAMQQYGTEFSQANQGWFDGFINGINRLPRPIMALGTVGLFVFAMANPDDFAVRMQGLAYVPDPLWWLLGAVVSFYFGARELHYARGNTPVLRTHAVQPDVVKTESEIDNSALSEWKQLQD